MEKSISGDKKASQFCGVIKLPFETFERRVYYEELCFQPCLQILSSSCLGQGGHPCIVAQGNSLRDCTLIVQCKMFSGQCSCTTLWAHCLMFNVCSMMFMYRRSRQLNERLWVDCPQTSMVNPPCTDAFFPTTTLLDQRKNKRSFYQNVIIPLKVSVGG